MTRNSEIEERLRQSLERLHRAELESLETRQTAPFTDAYGALRGLLEHAGAIGSLLVRIEREEGDVADSRRRLVGEAVECGTILAQVLGLAFELEGRTCRECGARERGPAPPRTDAASLRAVTDLNRMLVAQLRQLFQTMQREPGWRTARPEELWRKLLVDVADLLPGVAALDLRDLGAEERQGLEAATADAANRLAILRSYPRTPTV